MRVRRWMPFLLLTSGILLSGCGTGIFDRPTGGRVAVPDVVEYSKQVQDHTAAELSKLGPACPRDGVFGGCSAVKRFVIDYGRMRDQARAAQ